MLHELEDPTPSWGTPLWYAALAGRRDITELLLNRGADPNANVYASGWPLRNASRHEDVKRLLLARGAKPQPYMIAEPHEVEEARQMLDAAAGEDASELARELAWAAACHGCSSIVELALSRLTWSVDDPRWHWILIQPIRGVSGEPAKREGFFACMLALLRRGIVNVPSQFGETALHYLVARPGPTEAERVRFATMLLDHGARLDARDSLLQSTPLGWACRWGRKDLVELLIARGAPFTNRMLNRGRLRSSGPGRWDTSRLRRFYATIRRLSLDYLYGRFVTSLRVSGENRLAAQLVNRVDPVVPRTTRGNPRCASHRSFRSSSG